MCFGNSFNNDERSVCAGYDNGDIKLYDLRTNQIRSGPPPPADGCGPHRSPTRPDRVGPVVSDRAGSVGPVKTGSDGPGRVSGSGPGWWAAQPERPSSAAGPLAPSLPGWRC